MQRRTWLETAAIGTGVMVGAVSCGFLWVVFLLEPVFAALFGEGYYFADSIMFIIWPLALLLVGAVGGFAGGAIADYGVQWRRTAGDKPVQWTAVAAGVVGLVVGVLLAYGYNAQFTPIGKEALVLVPIALVPLFLFLYARLRFSASR